ncbi:MAG: hypothetical protein KC493_14965 [Bacteriovoracaceae bacterium]|nr:hypothetical protein [Bacteriovoracaceae bacterium]
MSKVKFVLLLILTSSCLSGENTYKKTFKSNVLKIDKIYKSMVGPKHFVPEFYLDDSSEKELLWVKGYRAKIFDSSTGKELTDQYMCHANVFLPNIGENDLFEAQKNALNGTTLSQGITNIEFPEGFGVPLSSNMHHFIESQVLNLNEEKIDLNTYQTVEISYTKNKESSKQVKALFSRQLVGRKSLDGKGKYYNIVGHKDKKTYGVGCLVGKAAQDSAMIIKDDLGNKYTYHWVVEPGKEVNHSVVTPDLNLEYDTSIHVIVPHLHPFAESIELRDITAGKVIFRAEAKNSKNRIGLTKVDHYSDAEGIAVYKDHEYELISVYNNTSDKPQDSMAVLNVFVLDKKFKKK